MSHNLTTCMLSLSNDTGARRRSLSSLATFACAWLGVSVGVFTHPSSCTLVLSRWARATTRLLHLYMLLDESMYGYRTTDDTYGHPWLGAPALHLTTKGRKSSSRFDFGFWELGVFSRCVVDLGEDSAV